MANTQEITNKPPVAPTADAGKTETPVQRRARIASIRSRNAALDWLSVENPDPNHHYEWEHNDPVSIMKKQNLGFEIVTEKCTLAAHGRGDGANIAGDVILMRCTKETKADIDFVDRQEYQRRHGVKNKLGEITTQIEEREFDSRASGLSIIEESSAVGIDGNQLKKLKEG